MDEQELRANEGSMDVEGFLLSNGVDHEVLVTIPPSAVGPFNPPDVREHIDGYWVEMSRLPNRKWSDQTRAVGAVLTYLRGLSAISTGLAAPTR
ncbi:MAG: hypothetical protein DYH03_20310 [Nitrospira sp. NTP1]|nr:hypothetical protein [Nitrospira sp. NTP1]